MTAINPFTGKAIDTTQKTTLTIGRQRRDGKYPVRYLYPLSGKVFNKIYTTAKVREEALRMLGAERMHDVRGHIPSE